MINYKNIDHTNKKGFTLIELLAVIVILAVILSISVPAISGIVSSSTKGALMSDAKMVLNAIRYKKLADPNFNPTDINKENMGSLLGLSNNNYKDIKITKEDDVIIITIIGKDKWNGLVACGTYNKMSVVESTGDCATDLVSPVITLLGDNPTSIFINDIYNDAGATATDDKDGNITDRIIVNGTINPSLPGDYTITYTVVDNSGNTSIAQRTVKVIDNANPIITFSPMENTTYVKDNYVNINVTDASEINNSSLKYVWTDSTVQPTIDEFSLSFSNNQMIKTPTGLSGSYYLWAMASDVVGNQTIARTNVFNLDNEAPVITLIGDVDVTVNKGSSYIDAGATVTDNIDTNINVVSSGDVNVNVVGTYTITYNASDSAGNTASPKTRTINVIDVDAPVITILGDNPAIVSGGTSYSDAGATALDDVDGNVTSSIQTTGTVNPSVVGTYTITYTVSDKTGNTSTAKRTVNVIDNIAPTVVFGMNGNSTYAKSRSTTVTVSDSESGVNTSSLKYQWTTSTTTPSEASFSTTLTNGSTINTPAGVSGSYYLWILAKDNATNTSITRTNVFNVDNTVPTLTIEPNGCDYAKSASPIITITDAHSGVDGSSLKYQLTSNTVQPSEESFSTPFTNGVAITITESGPKYLWVLAKDNLGNTTITGGVVFLIDNSAPTVAFGTNGNSTYAKSRSTTIMVYDGFGILDTSSLKYQWTTSTTTPSVGSFSTSFTNNQTINTPSSASGSYYLWVIAKDTLGNQAITRTNVFNLDNTKPVITMNGTSPVRVNKGSADTDAGTTASDVHSGINGSVTATGSVNVNIVGTYTITYTVSDKAGNQATSVTRTVNVIAADPFYTKFIDGTYFTQSATNNYAKIGNDVWRVMYRTGNIVKLIHSRVVGTSIFGTSTTYSGSTLESYVNNWCSNNGYNSYGSCDNITKKEIECIVNNCGSISYFYVINGYLAPTSGYWTKTSSTSKLVWLVYGPENSYYFGDNYLDANIGVRPILNANSTVKVIGGTGTSSDPYILSL